MLFEVLYKQFIRFIKSVRLSMLSCKFSSTCINRFRFNLGEEQLSLFVGYVMNVEMNYIFKLGSVSVFQVGLGNYYNLNILHLKFTLEHDLLSVLSGGVLFFEVDGLIVEHLLKACANDVARKNDEGSTTKSSSSENETQPEPFT